MREEGDILVDGKRRLMAGTIVEEWDLEACGKLLKLALAIAADGAGKGGIFLAIAEKDPEEGAVGPQSGQPTPTP